MFVCPISGLKLKRASAKGGSLWYSPASRGRLVTLVMAKHYLGADAAREIWVRSQITNRKSEYDCPSCKKKMLLVSQPAWLASGEIDVCRNCQMIWINPDVHPSVPHPEDF